MFATIYCLQQHDYRLVLLAGLICLVGSAASVGAYRRAAQTSGGYRLAWAAAVALLLGCGIWTTHFVAILAYQQALAIGFELGGTAISLLIAVGGIGAGVLIAVARPKPLNRVFGGGVWGLSIALMHFTGVAAMRLPASIEWNPRLALVSVLIGVVGAAGALLAAGDLTQPWRRAVAPILLTLAICGLHFTAMGAITLHPAPMVAGPTVYSRDGLALGLGVLVALILVAGGGMLTVDRFSRRTALTALHRVLDQAPTALGFFDEAQRLVFWNRSYRDILASYGVQVRHRLNLREIAAITGGDHIIESAHAAALSVEPLHFEPVLSPQGRWFDFHLSATGDGGFVAVLNDVTVHRELASREAEARLAAESASRATSEFLANMSHEIRTPLNAVLGMAQVLGRSKLTPSQREQLRVIDEAGRTLMATLNDVLDLTKIEAAKLELEPHHFDLAEVVESTAAPYAHLCAQKDLAFRVEIAPDALGWWVGDSTRLRQVLSNLISNAVKFTASGQICVRVERGEGGVCFSVTDTGICIPAAKQTAIFEKFTQADASTTRRFGGTGLGLAICDSLVRLMGGKIEVISREGAGACFSFSIPLAAAQAPAVAPPAAPQGAAGRPLRILAAEDNPTNQLILAALLEPLGAELSLVEDGWQAVEAVRHARFDLILMDAQMPVMNGLEATAQIRELEAAADAARTPIIALTANVMHHQLEDYVRAGMDGWVAKPIEAPKLFAALQRAISPPSQQDMAQSA